MGRRKKRVREPGRPAGTIIPTLEGRGCVCPWCGTLCYTPIIPHGDGTLEKTLLLANETVACPGDGCEAVHWITEAIAEAHNAKWAGWEG